jgi:hypothetical protein
VAIPYDGCCGPRSEEGKELVRHLVAFQGAHPMISKTRSLGRDKDDRQRKKDNHT